MQVISLKMVDVNSLRMLFGRSLSVSNLLAFKLTSEQIESIVLNSSDSFCKHWKTSTTGIFESEKFDQIRVVVFEGSFFAKTILSYFSEYKETEIKITVNDAREALKIELISDMLHITFKTARVEMSKDSDLSSTEYDMLFNITNALTSFTLPAGIISKIDHLKAINSRSDEPVNFVKFEGANGVLECSDTSFKLKIAEYDGSPFSVKFNKQFLSLLDPEDHIVYVAKEESFDKFVMQSKHAEIDSWCSAILMKDVSQLDDVEDSEGTDSNWEDFGM